MPDPIDDIKAGLTDAVIKKKYNLKDEDLFTLKKFNYATKSGASKEDALEMYPEVGQYLSKKATELTPQYKEALASGQKALTSVPGLTLDPQQQKANAAVQRLIKDQQSQRFTQVTGKQDLSSISNPVPQPSSPVDTTEEDNQKAADDFYATKKGRLFYDFLQPVWKTAGEGGAKMIAGAMRGLNKLPQYTPLGYISKKANQAIGFDQDELVNKASDAIVDYWSFDRASKEKREDATLYSTPTKLQGGLINDGKMNTAKLIPSTIEAFTTIGTFLGGAGAMGGGKLATLGAGYLTTVEDARKVGKDAGLKGDQLDGFSNAAAGITGTLFMGFPAKAVTGTVGKMLFIDAAKKIASGVTVKAAMSSAIKQILKANLHASGTLLAVKAADHLEKAAVDAMKDEPVFNEELTYGKMRDEVAETILMAVLPTTLMMAPSTLRHHTPNAQVKSSLLYAASDIPKFSSMVDTAVAEGRYTPEQAQTMKDNIGKFSTQVNQLQKNGYSPDQSTRMAWAAYKDGKLSTSDKPVQDNPILRETIGKEAEKDREVLKDEIKDAAKGIPEMGSEITGEDLQKIVENTPNSPKSLSEKITGKDFRLEETDLQEKYDSDPSFKLAVENYEKSKEDPEGLRTPAIVDSKGEVLDGNKRLIQQYVNGEKTARVFKELKSEAEVTPEADQSPAVENTEVSIATPPDNGTSLSGITPEAKEKIIEKRKAKTTLSARQEKVNTLLQDADTYNALPNGRLGKTKSAGVQALNDLKVRATDLGLTYDPARNQFNNKSGGAVQKRFLKESNQSLIENHTDLAARPPEVREAFKSLYENADLENAEVFFPNDVTGADGKTLNQKQLRAALSDVFDGIPSSQAENYLNKFQGMVEEGSVHLTNGGEKISVPFDEYMTAMTSAKSEVDASLSEGSLPVPDDVAQKWLEDMEKEMSEPGFEDWFNDNNLETNGQDSNAEGYPQEQATSTGRARSDESRTTPKRPKDDVSKDGAGSVLEEAYQEVAGFAPNPRVGGIQVEPILGGQPKDLSRIILDVGHGLKQNIFFSKTSARAAGTYGPGSTAIKIKYNGDLDTTAHEIGHAIDDKFKILPEILSNPAATSELPQFSRFGSQAPKGHPNPAKYEANEGFAEFLRALIVNPAETRVKAPELAKIYDNKVPDAAKKTLDQFSTDIRTWAGATGADITKANIQFKPEEAEGIIKKLFGKKATSKEFEINNWDWLSANFVNPMRVFEKSFEYAKTVKGVTDVLPENNPTLLARLLLGIDGKFGQVLKNGMIDAKGQLLLNKDGNPKNLKWLIEPLDNTDVASVERDMKDVITYMVSERTVELGTRYQRETLLSGVGGGIFADLKIAEKTLDEYNNGDPDKLVRIKEAGARYREMADDTLKYLVDKGRLDVDQYNKIKAENTQYVAMQRIIETEPDAEVIVYKGAGGKLTSVADPVKKIKGSTKKISNPYTSLLDTLHKSLKEGDRNDAMRAFRDMLVDNRGMNQGDIKRLADVGVLAREGDKNTTTIFIKGKPEKWKFQQDVFENLNQLDHDKYKIPGALKLYGAVLRTMTTKFPTFAVRNWIRDIQDRLIKSNDGSGFKDLFGDPADWSQVERVGGLNAGYYTKSKEMYYGLMSEAINQVAKNKGNIIANPEKLKAVWHAYESALMKSETSNRVAEYRAAFKKAKSQGMDDYNASLYGAFKSRDLMDFGVAGHMMKVINQMVPFSNAAVQGLRTASVRIKENPKGFLARTALYSVLPQMLFWFWNHRDDEEAEQYENLPTYQRDLFYNMKLGPDTWLSLPKPYELSLMGSGADRALSFAWGNEKAFDGYAGTVSKLMIPLDENSAFGPFKPVVENMANYDSFRDKTIVSPFENVLDLSLRNTQTASRLGQLIQEAAGIDARKADHFIQSTFSYVGKTAMQVSDIGRKESKNGFDLTTLGIFKHSPGYNSAPVQEMMKFATEWQLTAGGDYKKFNAMSKEYFAAKTDEEKEQQGNKLIEYSKDLLDKWEKEGIAGKKADAKEEKRNKEASPVSNNTP